VGRQFRPPAPQPTVAVDPKKKAAAIVQKARRSADALTREAERASKVADYKLDVIDRLLPNGFTAAPNPALLPPQIQEKIKKPVQEVLDSATMTSFIATPAHRQLVYDYAKFGVPVSDIILRLINPNTGRPITPGTFKQHFDEEYGLGRADGNIAIAQVGYEMTVGRPAEFDENGVMVKPAKDPNPSVLIAQAKHRLGWQAKKDITITHNSGVDAQTAGALKELTEDELRQLREIATGRRLAKSTSPGEGD
jgi:hypothetical protein